jgi:hypothetical protein
MNLEHRKQQVATFRQFSYRMIWYGLIVLGLVIFSIFFGTLGYHFFGELIWLDSFYMACMVLNGVGPVAELSTSSGKVFSSFFALYSGVVYASMTVILLTPIIHRVFHILHFDNDEAVE